MKIVKSVFIKRRPEHLWEWLTQFDKMKKWNKSVIEEKHISSGEVRKGYITRLLIKEGKKKVWYDNEMLDYKPHKYLRIALKGGSLGKSPMIVSYELFNQENGTRLEYKNSWKPIGLMLKILYPLIKKAATRNAENVLLELKEQVENHSVS